MLGVVDARNAAVQRRAVASVGPGSEVAAPVRLAVPEGRVYAGKLHLQDVQS
ncbi:MAG: hypothetical protein HYX97_03020 [Chloroflexi bacterium]|nr:hypothetical protein [Chloroflexota bacterium]